MEEKKQAPQLIPLPLEGFCKLDVIIGNPKKGIVGHIPMSRGRWYGGIKAGFYPAPVKLLFGTRSAAWRVEDVRELIERLGGK